MAVRLKKLHESAQARYEKSKDGLVTAVAQQQPVLTGQLHSTSSSVPHMQCIIKRAVTAKLLLM